MIYCGDSLELMKTLETGSVDAVIADPPYNIGKASWDKIPKYLEWCREWITEAARIMKRQGSFWCFHSDPLVLADIAKIIEGEGKPQLNWVTWDKYNGSPGGIQFIMNRSKIGRPEGNEKRTIDQDAEYITYHAESPIAGWITAERDKQGLLRNDIDMRLGYVRKSNKARGTELCRRWEEGSSIPSEYDIARLSELFGSNCPAAPTFNNPGKVSSVWQFPPAKPNGHPTPKPVELIRRIVETTTNPGDVILDPFAGSGTTGVACIRTHRKYILIEKDPKYVAIIEHRIKQTQPPLMMAL